MDTSKEYVLMCEKAEEIQAIREGVFESGDYTANHNYEWYNIDEETKKRRYKAEIELCRSTGYTFIRLVDNPFGVKKVWLPRQDQLIDMLVEDGDYYYDALYLLYNWTRGGSAPDDWRTKDSRNFTSMEQLWWAFVMKELYSKTWTGSEWESC